MKQILFAIVVILITWGFFALIVGQNKTKFNLEFEGQKWFSFVVDSNYLDVRNPDGSLLKREEGTYRRWELIDGELLSVIRYRTETMSLPNNIKRLEKYTTIIK